MELEESAIKELVKRAGDFVAKVVGPPGEALGGLLGDQVQSWRAANLDRIARKWEKIRKRRGISAAAVQVLPFGDAYRIFESASLEENDNVQELWARMIANATDPDREMKVDKYLIDLLTSLGSVDAILLRTIFDHAGSVPLGRPDDAANRAFEEFDQHTRKLMEPLNNRDVAIAVENLIRLRIIAIVASYPALFGEIESDMTVRDHVRKLKREKTADALVEIVDHLNMISGWHGTAEFEDLSAHEIALLAIDSYSLTPLGFELCVACSD